MGAAAGAVELVGAGSYRFDDKQPLPFAYYRLKMIDLDGSFTFSDVLLLERDEAPTMTVYPNPSAGRFTVDLPLADGQTATLICYDLAGRVMFQALAKRRYEQRAELPAGIYFLSAELSSGRVTRRIVVR